MDFAEAIRYAQKGAVDPSEARDPWSKGLLRRSDPVVEEIDGRVYLHARKKSAVDVALVALARRHPKRIDRSDLTGMVQNNGFTLNNARISVSRITKYVDDDGNGRLRLLVTGLKRAETIIHDALKSPN